MRQTLRSALGGALVLCASALAACSDSPTGGLGDTSSDAAVVAANRNVGGGARVVQVGRDEQKSATVQKRLRPGGGARAYIDYGDCYLRDRYVAYDVIDDPCAPQDPCQYSPDPYCCYDYYAPGCPGYVPPGPAISVGSDYTYNSDASAISTITANGTILKTLTLSSFSQAIQNVASTSLSVSYRNVGGQSGCYVATGQFDSSYASGTGSPLYLSSSRTPAWQGVIRWEVVGTHSFSPASGFTGGGTFSSSDSECG